MSVGSQDSNGGNGGGTIEQSLLRFLFQIKLGDNKRYQANADKFDLRGHNELRNGFETFDNASSGTFRNSLHCLSRWIGLLQRD